MKRNFILAISGVVILGLMSTVSLSKQTNTVTQELYEVTKSCKKGYVKNKKKKCVKLVCDKNHYMDEKKMKCLPKRTLPANSY